MKLNDHTYDTLKWVATLLLPALGTLYFALSQIWGFPYAEQVLGTITAIDTFLGALLGLSNSVYEGDGTLVVDTSNPQKDTYRFELNCPLEDISRKKTFTVKVDTKSSIYPDA